jgi:hypothetical protein
VRPPADTGVTVPPSAMEDLLDPVGRAGVAVHDGERVGGAADAQHQVVAAAGLRELAAADAGADLDAVGTASRIGEVSCPSPRPRRYTSFEVVELSFRVSLPRPPTQMSLPARPANVLLAFTLATNIEHLTLTGAAAVNATGNTAANTLRGNAAANGAARRPARWLPGTGGR